MGDIRRRDHLECGAWVSNEEWLMQRINDPRLSNKSKYEIIINNEHVFVDVGREYEAEIFRIYFSNFAKGSLPATYMIPEGRLTDKTKYSFLHLAIRGRNKRLFDILKFHLLLPEEKIVIGKLETSGYSAWIKKS